MYNPKPIPTGTAIALKGPEQIANITHCQCSTPYITLRKILRIFECSRYCVRVAIHSVFITDGRIFVVVRLNLHHSHADATLQLQPSYRSHFAIAFISIACLFCLLGTILLAAIRF